MIKKFTKKKKIKCGKNKRSIIKKGGHDKKGNQQISSNLEKIINKLERIIFPMKTGEKWIKWFIRSQNIDMNNVFQEIIKDLNEIEINRISKELEVPEDFFKNQDKYSILWFKYFDGLKFKVYLVFFRNINGDEGNKLQVLPINEKKIYLLDNNFIYKILEIDYEESKINAIKENEKEKGLILDSLVKYSKKRRAYFDAKILIETDSIVDWTIPIINTKDDQLKYEEKQKFFDLLDSDKEEIINIIVKLPSKTLSLKEIKKKDLDKIVFNFNNNDEFDIQRITPIKIPIELKKNEI